MAVVCDTTLDFNDSSGYAFDPDDIEFVGGSARLKTGVEDASLLVTPDVDVSELAMLRAEPVVVESVGYEHWFLASFDAGDTWMRYGPSGWERKGLADILAIGMSAYALSRVREWPAAAPLLRFAIAIRRESGGGDGGIDQIGICHGEDVLGAGGEPDGDCVLAPAEGPPIEGCDEWIGIMPDFPVSFDYEDVADHFVSDMGYEQCVNRGSRARCRCDVQWGARLEFEKDLIVRFLNEHIAHAFIWTPPGFDAPLKWVAYQPEILKIDVGVWSVSSRFREVFPE